MIYATIRKYNSKSFPYEISWKYKGSKYRQSTVFSTKEECISYIKGRFGKVKIYDHTED